MAGVPNEINRNGLFQNAVDFAFGYDFFISYSHRDGQNYPKRLKERLEQAGFKVFLDMTEYAPGMDLRRETYRQVSKSRKVVVVGRAASLASEWVQREVDIALARGKPPIIININSSIEAASTEASVAAIARESHWLRLNETIPDSDGDPTDQAILELVRGFSHTRQETKRLRAVATAAAVLAIATGIAIWQAVDATFARDMARGSEKVAQSEKKQKEAELERAQTQQSRFLAELSDEARRADDPEAATLFALAGLPKSETKPERPLVDESRWRLAQAMTDDRLAAVLKRHTNYVHQIAWSPDGAAIASASLDRSAIVWDLRSGAAIVLLKDHTGNVNSVAFSPDGGKVATADDGTARLWDTGSGTEIQKIASEKGPVRRIKFAPRSDRIVTVSGNYNRFEIWDSSLKSRVAAFDASGTNDINLDATGSRLLTCVGSATAWIWNVETGQQVTELKGHLDNITGCAWSADGMLIATTADDRTIKLWDAATGEPRRTLLSNERLRLLSVSSNQRLLAASASDYSIRIWDLLAEREIAVLRGHEGAIQSINWGQGDTALLSASSDRTARVWKIAIENFSTVKGPEAPSITLRGHNNRVTDAQWSPDGALIATASWDSTLRIWKTAPKETAVMKDQAALMARAEWSHDGRHMLTTGEMGVSHIRDANTGIVLSELPQFGGMSVGAFSPDGSKVVIGNRRAKVAKVFNVATGSQVGVIQPIDELHSVAYSPDGRNLVTSDAGGKIRIWDDSTYRLVADVGDGSALANEIKWNADGTKLAAGLEDGSLRVYSAPLWAEVQRLSDGKQPLNSLGWSPDGESIVTTSRDGVVRAWDLGSSKIVFRRQGMANLFSSAAYMPDGRRILTAVGEPFVGVLDALGGRKLNPIYADEYQYRVHFAVPNREGTHIVALTARGGTILNAATGRVIGSMAGAPIGIASCPWNADGTLLAAATGNGAGLIWDVETQVRKRVLMDYTASWRLLSWSRDGSRLFAFSDHGEKVLLFGDKADKAEKQFKFPGVTASAMKQDHSMFAVGYADGRIDLINAESGERVSSLRSYNSRIRALSFNPEGTRLLAAYIGAIATVWDIESGKPRDLIGMTDSVLAAAWSRDGRRIATGSSGGLAYVWDAETTKLLQVMRGHRSAVTAARFNPEATLVVTASEDHSVRVWEAASGQQISAFAGHTNAVTDAAFSPGGSRIASCSNDGTVRLWPWNVTPGESDILLAEMRSLRGLSDNERKRAFLFEDSSEKAVGSISSGDCDALAGHPRDNTRKTGHGIAFNRLDPAAAIAVCEQAVKREPDQPRFKYNLGRAFSRNGNDAEAIRLFRAAADAGHAAAFNNLSVAYTEGKGVEKNLATSIELEIQAFERGLLDLGSSLGQKYWDGAGVPQDRAKAKSLWERAAAAGYANSHEQLGWIAELGRDGNPADLKRAFFHYALAVRLREEADETKDAAQARIRRGTLARSLSATETVAAWREIRDWKPSKL